MCKLIILLLSANRGMSKKLFKLGEFQDHAHSDFHGIPSHQQYCFVIWGRIHKRDQAQLKLIFGSS